MMCIPMQSGPNEFVVHLILGNENIERLKAYDPAEFLIGHLPPPYRTWTLKGVMLMYATPEEQQRLQQIGDVDRLIAELKQLSRGWTYKPEQGDHDGDYQAPTKN